MSKDNVTAAAGALDESQPIDSIVKNLVETIHRKGRGFVLGLARDGDAVKVEVVESLRPHDEWRPPADYRAHRIESTESFIDYAIRYGTPEKSLVFYSTDVCTLTIDEHVERGQREVVTLKLETSDDWRAWSAILEKPQDHRTLLRFLLSHEANLADPAVLRSMQSIRATSTVNYESDITDDGDNVAVSFKSQKGDELKKFPKSFNIVVPVLDGDVESPRTWEATNVRLEITMPQKPGENPTFTLFCSTWKHALKRRIAAEGAKIKAALDGWTVINGLRATVETEVEG